MSQKRYRFIINPISGERHHTQRIIKEIEKQFTTNNEVKHEISFTEKPGHATQLAKSAVQEGFDAVVAVGGDGTMNEVASALVNSKTALGLLPRGSGNGYARSLNIPLNISAGLKNLVRPKKIAVDVGQVNQYFFFGVSGVGFDAEIGAKFQNFGIRGPLPYFLIGLKEYFYYQYEEFIVVTDRETFRGKPLLISVANTMQYGLGAVINPGADYADGKFEICIVHKVKFLREIFRLPKLFNGSINELPIYKRLQTDHLKIIRSRDQGYFHTDGEPRFGGKELNFKIIKHGLNVLV